ncbi:hypothetical protein TNCV_8801 [Trichonephila clavipes]|nr:hypothetical protein TNCV_8801 [Trichonephila clavipes]
MLASSSTDSIEGRSYIGLIQLKTVRPKSLHVVGSGYVECDTTVPLPPLLFDHGAKSLHLFRALKQQEGKTDFVIPNLDLVTRAIPEISLRSPDFHITSKWDFEPRQSPHVSTPFTKACLLIMPTKSIRVAFYLFWKETMSVGKV